MNLTQLRNARQISQYLAPSSPRVPLETVRHLVALQAQDYAGAKWSVAIRSGRASEADIDAAILSRQIVRTWPMRGTLHFVASDDLRWMLRLLAPRIIAGSAGRHRQLGLDEVVFAKSRDLFVKKLGGNPPVTRNELFLSLQAAGIATSGQRGVHILNRLAMEGLICFGPHQAKEPAFVLTDEWLPPVAGIPQDEALARLARRYFTGHGPATLKDFVWWSGLKISDARRGLAAAASGLDSVRIGETEYFFDAGLIGQGSRKPPACLLPGFDEYLLGYTDRSHAIDPAHAHRIVPGNNGMFMPTVLLNGTVAGTWKKVVRKNSVQIRVDAFGPLSGKDLAGIRDAAARYCDYLGLQLESVAS